MHTHDIIYSNKSKCHIGVTLLLSVLHITHHRPSEEGPMLLYCASWPARHVASDAKLAIYPLSNKDQFSCVLCIKPGKQMRLEKPWIWKKIGETWDGLEGSNRRRNYNLKYKLIQFLKTKIKISQKRENDTWTVRLCW